MLKRLVGQWGLGVESAGDGRIRRLSFWRWFLAASLVIVLIISTWLAWMLSGFMEARMLERDSKVSMEFVNSIVRVNKAGAYFYGETQDPSAPEMERLFLHLARLPDVIRANVYGMDRTMLWSSNSDLIGESFDDNDELELTFQGKLDPHINTLGPGEKEEHVDFPPGVTMFIENYLPVWDSSGTRVIGAVELYKRPESLIKAIKEGQRYVWIGTAGAACFLFLALGSVVMYARRILREQEAENVEMERLAVVGEMASAVAHGLRNPLAAIRSCAELALEDDLSKDARESITDIVSQSDRLEGWIRSFLKRSRNELSGGAAVTQIDEVIQESLRGFTGQLSSRNITVEFSPQGHSPLVAAQDGELQQVLNSVLSNGIEAIKSDGKLTILRTNPDDGMVTVVIQDTGPGVQSDVLASAFNAFVTSKPSGLGIGLSLSRRILHRIGGSLELQNLPSIGAQVQIRLPASRAA